MWLERDGFPVQEFASGVQAIEEMRPETAVVCLDLGLGDIPGVDVLRHLRAADPRRYVIVTTANTEVPTVVEAMKAGAIDYLTKPIDGRRLIDAVSKAVSHRAMLAQEAPADRTEQRILDELSAQSPAMREVVRHVLRVLDNNVTVFLQGESGTGKEMIARIIHNHSQQRGPFVAVNCAAIPPSLQESELFGHEKGAFTGATSSHPGKFEQATGGSLFLDEVAEMAAPTQAALLRVLQERAMVRVGGSDEITVNARIISATHRDLIERVRSNLFREDLYYRMVVYPIRLPALRERLEDLPGLIGTLLRGLPIAVQRGIDRASPDALEALRRYPWPGNVRELTNVLQRASLACDSGEIGLAHLPREIQELFLKPLPSSLPPPPAPPAPPRLLSLRDLEREAIRNAISAAKGNMSAAAKLLGVSRATLYRRINEERNNGEHPDETEPPETKLPPPAALGAAQYGYACSLLQGLRTSRSAPAGTMALARDSCWMVSSSLRIRAVAAASCSRIRCSSARSATTSPLPFGTGSLLLGVSCRCDASRRLICASSVLTVIARSSASASSDRCSAASAVRKLSACSDTDCCATLASVRASARSRS